MLKQVLAGLMIAAGFVVSAQVYALCTRQVDTGGQPAAVEVGLGPVAACDPKVDPGCRP